MADVSQNISAQLFVKELPPSAVFTGCKQDFSTPYLTTCVNNVESDRAVENAFQSQLNLSEYYKSPYVFDTIKHDYMDQVMEKIPSGTRFKERRKQVRVSVVPKVPVGPRDFMGNIKESFGNSKFFNWYIIFIIIIVILLLFKTFKPT